jgi:hypothetical protein
MVKLKDGLTTVVVVFVAAIGARFGWELGGWLIKRLF